MNNTKSTCPTCLSGTGRQAGPVRRNCPPLTKDDIFALRGKPVAKKVETSGNDASFSLEEWIYYNIPINTKEHYFFKNGHLIGWGKKTV